MSEILSKLQIWDEKWIWNVIAFRGSRLTRFMKIMSSLGDGYIYVLAALGLFWMAQLSVEWIRFTVFAFAFELILYKLIKSGTSRPRPYQADGNIINLVIPPDQYSFPSGHTAAATVAAIAFGMIFPAWLPVFFGFIVLVGFSRIYLGVHYPTDVLVGFVLGLVSCALSTLTNSFIF